MCGHEAGRRRAGRAQGVKAWYEFTLGCHPPSVAGTSCLCLLAAYLFSRLSLVRGRVGGPAFTPIQLFLLDPKWGLGVVREGSYREGLGALEIFVQ